MKGLPSRDQARGAMAFLTGIVVAILPLSTRAQDAAANQPRPLDLRFLDGLRERGYYDLGLEYLDELRRKESLPPEVKATLDFEEGKGLLEEAKVAPDILRREQLFNQARVKLDEFLSKQASHPSALEARVLLAQLLYQRGQTSALKANEATTESERDQHRKEARTAFAMSRRAFDEAIGPLQAAYDAFPIGFLEEKDPRAGAREQAHIQLMDTKLKRALVDYEDAQTYPAGSAERNQLLDTAIASFKDLHDRYRTWMAGIAARMWQGKCFEEKGDLGAAIGIYNELLDHQERSLYPLQRQVAFFKIIATGKRSEYPLAERLAREWLAISQGDQGSYERLGVQFELAKSLDQQLSEGKITDGPRRKQATDEIVQQLSEVVRVVSPFKPEAVALLKKYRPTGSVDSRTLANLNFDQSMERAREAIGIQEWETAAAYLKSALAKVNAQRQPDNANQARYLLAFARYQGQNYYEAAVLASFLAKRYPKWESSPQAAELAMSAMALAYDSLNGPGREAELARLDSFASLVESNYAGTDQADVARILRGDIALGQGRYAEAASIFEGVTSENRKLDAQGKAAAAYWRQSLAFRKAAEGSANLPPEAVESSAKAQKLLTETLATRRDRQAMPTDPDLLRNLGDLAEIHVAENRPAEALALIEPATSSLANASLDGEVATLASRLFKLQLQAHIVAGQTDAAVADMRAVEKLNTNEPLTQLFFGLGRLLQREMDEQKTRGDRVSLERTRAAYEKFLDALVESSSGQSFESLQWAGESMLNLGKPDRAQEIFQRVLAEYPQHERINRTRLYQVSALRAAGKFNDAWREIDLLIRSNPRALDFLIERCMLLEDWARAEKGRWGTAIKYWQDLAKALERQRPRPAEYYDAWYHVAWCYFQNGNADYARRTLKSIMAISTTLGTPEIKTKYDDLLKKVGA